MNRVQSMAGRRYISFPAAGQRPNAATRAFRRLWGIFVLPWSLVSARLRGAPGLGCRLRCVALGIRALMAGDARRASALIVNPLDSFRYFELDVVLAAARALPVKHYLDVSSPRLVPIMILKAHPELVADVLNPLEQDLHETAATARAVGVGTRCRLHRALINDAHFAGASFDLITSISVVEHIEDDSSAVAMMWRLLRPNGKLIVTVPCAREACDEYTDLDEYQLLSKDADGFVYWQRYYNEITLAQRIWSVTGPPARVRIFGEKRAGHYDENVQRKRSDPRYPYWREPVMMGRDYRAFDRIDELPGMGVIAMEFTKTADR
jgi:SAM-dependent methyltransferase